MDGRASKWLRKSEEREEGKPSDEASSALSSTKGRLVFSGIFTVVPYPTPCHQQQKR